MKKCLSIILALAVIGCLLSVCIPSVFAAGDDSCYYYTVKVTTKIEGGSPSEAFKVYYSLHGVDNFGQNFNLFPYRDDEDSVRALAVHFEPGVTEQTSVLTFYNDEPVIGVRLLQEDPWLTGITCDEDQYYLEFPEKAQQPGLANAMTFEKLPQIEGFKDGGEKILSEPREPSFTLKYNSPPVFSGVEDGGEYFTTQQVRVQDADLVSVMLDDKTVEFENGEALVTLPGDTNKSYTITACDADWTCHLTVTMHELDELITPVSGINEKNVKAGDKGTLLTTLNNIDMVIEREPNASAEEKAKIDTMKKQIEGLLSRIDEALAFKDSENLKNTQDITADNVKLTDKEVLEKAESDLKKALDEYGENYSDSEKEALQKDLARISEALEALEALEDIEDSEDIEDIEEIEQTVTESPKTGDNSHHALWLALFMLSGAAALVTAIRKIA
ncbi:MAG: hypothetical protein IJC36_04735 [Clostridia bacterium]|nr:hypothetical protein [Clostridia bacterium]